jgi:hypothetical protein
MVLMEHDSFDPYARGSADTLSTPKSDLFFSGSNTANPLDPIRSVPSSAICICSERRGGCSRGWNIVDK